MLKVKNNTLSLNRIDLANIIRDGANYIIDNEFPEENKEVLSYLVEVEDDGTDILGKKNVSFELECEADVENESYEEFKDFRLKNGFGISSLWNLDSTILKFIVPRLKKFKERLHGFPTTYETLEDWKHDIDEMIWSMEWYLNDDCEEYVRTNNGSFAKDENNNLIETEEYKRAKNGWKLFSDNFFGLWD